MQTAWRVENPDDSIEGVTWWDSLTDQERCWWAAKMAGADDDVLYAIEKPWKYAEQAYKAAQTDGA